MATPVTTTGTDISTPVVNVSVGTGTKGLADVSGNDFMNILVKQLQMQDPFKPMTNAEMVNQLSSIRELEMNTRMSTKLEQLTDQQRLGSAASLIGKQVEGRVKDADGNEYAIKGVVTGSRYTDKGEVLLELDSGETLPLVSLQSVKNVEEPGVKVVPQTPTQTASQTGTPTPTSSQAA